MTVAYTLTKIELPGCEALNFDPPLAIQKGHKLLLTIDGVRGKVTHVIGRSEAPYFESVKYFPVDEPAPDIMAETRRMLR